MEGIWSRFGTLNSKELKHLEQQLEVSLKHVRSTKTQFMLDQLPVLKQKEQEQQEVNRALMRKMEGGGSHHQLSWENCGQHIQYGRQSGLHNDGLYQQLECDSTLQIGFYPSGQEQITVEAPAQNVNVYVPTWLL